MSNWAICRRITSRAILKVTINQIAMNCAYQCGRFGMAPLPTVVSCFSELASAWKDELVLLRIATQFRQPASTILRVKRCRASEQLVKQHTQAVNSVRYPPPHW
jgi:hypothetical protein